MKALFIHKRKYKNGDKRYGLSGLCSTEIAIGLGIPIFTPKIIPSKKEKSIFLNWGLTSIPWLSLFPDSIVINHPDCVKKAVDKKEAFKLMYGKVNLPLFTTSKQEAEEWFDEDPNTIIFCRTLSQSYQGKGIVIARSKEEVVSAPLYTKRVPKKYEYRVHIVNGQAVHIQQKKRLSDERLAERGIEIKDSGLIRCWNNGYIYSTNLVTPEKAGVVDDLISQAAKAVEAVGLNFGAVDLIVSSKGKVTVLEINTAPGVENGTIGMYVSALHNLILEINNEKESSTIDT